MDFERYNIVRFYADKTRQPRTIMRGLTLQQAQDHCNDPKTHKLNKKGDVIWFDGFTKQ